MELQVPILNHLRSIDEPCNVVELAHALGVLEPGDVVPERLRSTLTGLVRHQQIKRLHNGDGVLRYMAIGGTASPAAKKIAPLPLQAPAPVEAPAPTKESATPRAYPETHAKGVSASVLAAFVPGEDPIRRTTIESRISPPLSTTQVVMALQALRLKGEVVRHGSTKTATWSRVDGGMPVADKPAKQVSVACVISAPAALDHVKLGAAHAALLQARLAIDSALQALEA